MYQGNEKFLINGTTLDFTMLDFWRWGYSQLQNNISRSVLAEFIVANALDITKLSTETMRIMWRPFDLLSSDGYKVEVKCASYVQSWGCKHPDHVSFGIAPSRLPDETGDYKRAASKQRNSDVYVFCLFKGMSELDNPLNLDLWEFYILPTKILDIRKPTQKTITLPSLMKLKPISTDYIGLKESLSIAMNSFTNEQ